MKIRRTGAADYGRYIKALICGSPGAGKTLTASTWPNPIYASAEGGLMSVADRNVPYAEIKKSDELLRLRITLDNSPEVRQQVFGFPVDTVIIDTIDEVQKILVRERLAATKKEAFKGYEDWGWLGEMMDSIVTGFRNLPMNVVFTCHTKDVTDDENGRLFFKPNLQGSIADSLPKYFDLSLLLRTGQKKEIVDNKAVNVLYRYLQTVPDSGHVWIKDRSGKLPPEITIDFENDYQVLHDYIYSNPPLEEGTETTVGEEESAPKAQEATPTVEVTQATTTTEPQVDVKPVTQPESAPAVDGLVCTECGSTDLDDTQATLSKIKHRRVLCRPCFTDLKMKGAKK